MIDGTYKIQMDSPVGAKEGTAVLITSGEKLTGSLTAMGVQIDIENGKVADNSFTFGGKLESFVGPSSLLLVAPLRVTPFKVSPTLLTETLCLRAQGRVKAATSSLLAVQSIY